jgi:hypothetical protein
LILLVLPITLHRPSSQSLQSSKGIAADGSW